MAEENVFKDAELFSSIDIVEPVMIESANGGITWLSSGGMTNFGFAYYWREIPINILSFGRVIDNGVSINYMNKTDMFELMSYTGEIVNFSRYDDNLYMGKTNSDKFLGSNRKLFMFSVRDKLAKYTKSEVVKAERVKELMWNLGIVSTAQLIKQLRANKIDNPGCSPMDVNIAIDIWGADLAGLKGKSTAKRNHPIPNDYKYISTREIQTGYGDIMFWLGKPYLVIVLEPLSIILKSNLKNRSEEELYRATNKLLSKPMKAGFAIQTLYFDRESGMISDNFKNKIKEYRYINVLSYKDYNDNDIKDNLEIITTGSTSGIDKIERQIRVIKERARGIMSVLPYELPESMEDSLISFCVARINSEIKSTGNDNRSPRERFNGRMNSKSWIKHGFGNYCQVHSENSDSANYNGPEGRTIGALSLFPIDNVMGTWAYMNLSTWKVIFRNRATNMPISDDVIYHINNNSNNNSNIEDRQKELVSDSEGSNLMIDHHVDVPDEIIPNVIDEEVNVTSDGYTSESNHIEEIDENIISDTILHIEDVNEFGSC